MMKRMVVAALLASSALITTPQTALAAGGGDECELNCFWTTVYGPNGEVVGGYWTCSGIYMDCLEP